VLDFEQFLQGRNYDPYKERASVTDKLRKRMLESSSDCSFLERALPSDTPPATIDTDNVMDRFEEQEESKTRRQRRKLERSISLEGSVVSLSIKPQVKSFEKRRRHKTREDRYEPKKALVNPKPKVNRQKKGEKKEEADSCRKVPRNNSKDLMYRFSSKSVGLDRLTVRVLDSVLRGGLLIAIRSVRLMPLVCLKTAEHLPLEDVVDVSNTLHSFCYYANTITIVPDLFFSEMGFLKRLKQRPVEMEESKSLSKSKEKEKRRSERAQNEISEYFKSSRTLRDDIEQADKQQSSYTPITDQRLRQEGFLKDRYQSSCSNSTSQSINLSKSTLLGLDRQHDFKPLAHMPHPRGQMVQPAVAPDTVRKFPDRVTSYYTWSDSVRSPEASNRNPKICSEVSTTPESIRQMLNNTGVFANTGIDRIPIEIVPGRPARFNAHMKPPTLSKILNDSSSTTHARKSSHTDIQNRQSVEAAEISVSVKHRRHQEEQVKHPNESVNSGIESGKVLRPTNTTAEHNNPESGWRQHLTDNDEVATHHLSKAELPHQGISRKVFAQGAYVKRAPTTSAAALRNDDTKYTSLSAEAPEATTTHLQPTKHLIHEETNEETVDHSPPFNSGEKKLGGGTYGNKTQEAKSPADLHINHPGPVQALEPAISDSPLEPQPDTMLVPGVPVPSRTLEIVPDLHATYQQRQGSLDQIDRTRLKGHTHSAARAHAFDGLPVRGSWPSRACRLISASHAVFTPIAVEPLYNHQLKNRTPLNFTDRKYTEGDQADQLIHGFDTPLMEYLHDEEGELYDCFEGEGYLLNTTENLQEYDIMFSNELYTGTSIVEEEEEENEEHTRWKSRDQDMTLQAAPQQHSHARAHSAGYLDQQLSHVMGPNPGRERLYHHASYEPVRELIREDDVGENYRLNRFWQPRRQY
jgi:hypothetical protein